MPIITYGYVFVLFFTALCLKLTELKIEEHTLVGNSTRLECKYDLQGEKLYTVKWYKDGNEFYRFLPGETPEVQVFEVTGVHVDVSILYFKNNSIFFFFFFQRFDKCSICVIYSYHCLDILDTCF